MNILRFVLVIGLILAACGPAWSAGRAEPLPPSSAKPVVVMLGDSLIQAGLWAEYFPEAKVYNEGVGGHTTAQVGARLEHCLALEPDLLILMAGINDLGLQAPAGQVIDGQAVIWDEIKKKRPATKLIVLGLLPVIEARTSFRVSNRTIRDINRQLRQNAQNRGLIFIDLYPEMADRNGALRAELTRDGVHLTPEAYAIWREAIAPLINTEILRSSSERNKIWGK